MSLDFSLAGLWWLYLRRVLSQRLYGLRVPLFAGVCACSHRRHEALWIWARDGVWLPAKCSSRLSTSALVFCTPFPMGWHSESQLSCCLQWISAQGRNLKMGIPASVRSVGTSAILPLQKKIAQPCKDSSRVEEGGVTWFITLGLTKHRSPGTGGRNLHGSTSLQRPLSSGRHSALQGLCILLRKPTPHRNVKTLMENFLPTKYFLLLLKMYLWLDYHVQKWKLKARNLLF